MPRPPEVTYEQLANIHKAGSVRPQHEVLDDRRMKPFITMEEFEAKYKDFYAPKVTAEATTVKIDQNEVSEAEARRIYDFMHYTFDFNEFLMGMNVEMEHKDVTKGDLTMTAKIAAAHLNENPKYYTLLKQYVETDNG